MNTFDYLYEDFSLNKFLEGDWSSKYHYWQGESSYEYLSELVKDEEKLFDTIFAEDEGKTYQELKRIFPSVKFDTQVKEANDLLKVGQKEIIPIYRALNLRKGQSLDIEDLGVCWAWDVFAMREFARQNLDDLDMQFARVEMEGSTSRDNIDWIESVYLHDRYPKEHELRVIDPKKIKLNYYRITDYSDFPPKVVEKGNQKESW